MFCPNCGVEMGETHNFCLKCSIQLMKSFKPDSSLRIYSIREVWFDEGIEISKKILRKNDFSEKVLRSLKNPEDVCPPHITFSEENSALNFFTADVQSLEVFCDGFRELGGIDPSPNQSIKASLDEADNQIAILTFDGGGSSLAYDLDYDSDVDIIDSGYDDGDYD